MAFLLIFLFSSLFAEPVTLNVTPKEITVFGKKASVYTISQDNGAWGLTTTKGEAFDVKLNNNIGVSTSVHWHGLVLPSDQDGVAFITQFALYPQQSYPYQFPLKQGGTYFMHSHLGLQEQQLLSAPLIIKEEGDDKLADQEAVLLLADFSFRTPEEIYRGLQTPKPMNMSKGPDIVEVDYEGYLINYRSADNAEIINVKPGSKVRLRIINAASATNFFILLGKLKGEAIAVDGHRVKPLEGSKFELAVAQRIDIVVQIPNEGGAFSILVQGEGTDKQAGVLLTTGDKVEISAKAEEKAGAFSNEQEIKLEALHPLASRPINQRLQVVLGGDMSNYTWTLNGLSWPQVNPLVVEKGTRVEILLKNETSMSHPMHLHGHVFQVTAVDGKLINGAIRDTVLVMPNSSVTIALNADNPGVWPFHCHILYHLEAGMLTVLRYKDFIQPLVPIKTER
jgi:FtsP/CotA-like multicopper oxidase with cupredoxin domain